MFSHQFLKKICVVTFPENLELDFFPSTKHKSFVKWVWGEENVIFVREENVIFVREENVIFVSEENVIFVSLCEGRRSCFCGQYHWIMKRRGEEEKETLCSVGEGGG